MGALQAVTAIVTAGATIKGQQMANKQYKMQANEVTARQAEQNASAKANLELLQKTAKERESRRLDLLKSELARRRAIMGASGGGGGGSSEAVRFGLVKKSNREAEYDNEMDQYKIDQITRNLTARNRKNLMELSSLNDANEEDTLSIFGKLL